MNRDPRWVSPGNFRQPPQKPGAAVPGEPVKPKGRDYVGAAIAALPPGVTTDVRAGAKPPDSAVVAAIIIAQALDRFGNSLMEAAAVSTYKRS